MKKILLSVIATIIFVVNSDAQLLLDENFNYGSSSGNLTTITSNWITQGNTTPSLIYSTSNLSFVGYPSNSGGSAVLATGQDINRAFGTTVTSGVVYASFLINLSNASAAGDYFFHFMPLSNTSSTDFKGRVFARSTLGGYNLGISKAGAVATANFSNKILNYFTTYLVVVKYTIVSGSTNDIAELFVINSSIPTFEPTADASMGDPSGTDLNGGVGAVALRQAAVNAATLTLDGIRLAQNWNDAIGIPLPPSSANSITGFTLAGVSASIMGNMINVTVPSSTNLANVVASGTISPLATINPAFASVTDFSSLVNFTVTAEDLSTNIYTVNAYAIPKSTANSITGFTLAGVSASIMGSMINVTVPASTDLTNVVAEGEISPLATVNPSFASITNFSIAVTFTVTSENLDINIYTVNAVNAVLLSSAKSLTGFNLLNQASTPTISGLNVSVALPFGASLTNLTATGEISLGASVTPDLATILDYSSPVLFTVTAENMTDFDVYTVTAFNLPGSSENSILGFSVVGQVGATTISGNDISVKMPFGTNLTSITPLVTVSAFANYSPTTATDFTNVVNYVVTAQGGQLNTYNVSISNIAGSSAKAITAFNILGQSGLTTISGTTISLNVPFGTSLNALTATGTISSLATVNPSFSTAINYSSGFVFTVTAQDLSKEYYSVSINVLPEVTVPSGILLIENFEYGASNANLTLVASPWKAHSGSGANSVQYNNTSLSFSNYKAGTISGGSAIFGNRSSSSEDVNIGISGIINSGTLYAAALIKVSSLTGTGDYFLHFVNATSGTTTGAFWGRVGAKPSATPNAIDFGIGKNSSTLVYGSDDAIAFGSTVLIVNKYTFVPGATNDVSELFVVTEGNLTSNEPSASSSIGATSDADITNIAGLAFRQGSAGTSEIQADGIIVSTSWASLVNQITPPPTTPGVTFSGSTMPISQIRNSMDANGLSTITGEVIVEGRIYGFDARSAADQFEYVIIDNSGAGIRFVATVAGLSLADGDYITISGTLFNNRGQVQISSNNIAKGTNVPTRKEPTLVTSLSETTESDLIMIVADQFSTSGFSTSSSFNATFTTAGVTYTARFNASNAPLGFGKRADEIFGCGATVVNNVTLIGLGGQFNTVNSAPFNTGFQIYPYLYSDILVPGTVTPCVPPTFTGITPIVKINGVDASSFATTFVGTVTIAGQLIGEALSSQVGLTGGAQFSIVDESSATTLRIPRALYTTLGSNLVQGNLITVVGTMGQNNGLGQFTATQVLGVESSIAARPLPIDVTTITEFHEAKLIRVIAQIDSTNWNPAGGNQNGFNVNATIAGAVVVVRIYSNVATLFGGNFTQKFGNDEKIKTFTITGIGGQFDGSAPFNSGYQIVPYSLSDFSFVSRSASALVNSFKFLPQSGLTTTIVGTVSGQSINVVAPYGISLTGLIPTIEVSDFANVVPTDAVLGVYNPGEQVFSQFNVTAQAGNIVAYTVIAENGPNFATEVLSFKYLPNTALGLNTTVTGTVDGANLLATLPFGVTVTGLRPTLVLSEGARLSPNTTPVYTLFEGQYFGNITVKAQNNVDEQTYQIILTIAEPVSTKGFATEAIEIYPNPSTGEVSVKANIGDLVEVFDIIGNSVTSLKTQTSISKLSISKSGVYFVKISTASGKSITKKLIIE